MKKSIKNLVLCLLAVSALSISGSAYADSTEDNGITAADLEEAQEATSEKAKRTEAVEKAELSAEDAERYLEKIGSAEGYDVYRRDKDIGDRLWEAAGGRPKSKKDYTEEQKLLANKIDELKKLGELVIIDKKTGKDVTYMYNITPVDGRLELVDPSGNPGSIDAPTPGSGASTTTPKDTDATKTGTQTGTKTNTATTNSTGTGQMVKVQNPDGSVTYIHIPYEVTAALELGDTSAVLGARRGDTSDSGIPYDIRYLIILLSALSITAIFNTRKSRKTSL